MNYLYKEIKTKGGALSPKEKLSFTKLSANTMETTNQTQNTLKS